MKIYNKIFILFALLIFGDTSKASTIYENTLVNTFRFIFATNSYANIITSSVSGTITDITIQAKSGNVSPGNLILVNVCDESNNQPTNCITFTQQGQITAQPTLITFTNQSGYQVTANTNFMVTFSYGNGSVELYGSSTPDLYYYDGSQPGYTLLNPQYKQVYMLASGLVLPPPSSVPTLSEWTQIALALMTMGLVFWYHKRESV